MRNSSHSLPRRGSATLSMQSKMRADASVRAKAESKLQEVRTFNASCFKDTRSQTSVHLDTEKVVALLALLMATPPVEADAISTPDNYASS